MSSTSSVSSVAAQPPVSFRPPADNDRAQAAKAVDDKAKADERSAAKARKEDGKGRIVDVQA